MQRRKNDPGILLIVLFLAGFLCLICPIISQQHEANEDAAVYGQLARQVSTQDITVHHSVQPTKTPVIFCAEETCEPANTVPGIPVTPDTVCVPAMTIFPAVIEADKNTPALDHAPENTPAPTLPGKQETSFASTPLPEVKTDFENSDVCPPKATPGPTAKATIHPIQKGERNLELLKSQNSDFAAWLNIPGTGVNYPVVRSNRVDYYLHHLFTGEKSKLGCLFSLPSSCYDPPTKNIAIYGHHLTTCDAMFTPLLRYKRESYWQEHPFVALETLSEKRLYKIFAVFNMSVSDWDPSAASFASDKSFRHFINRAIDASFYDTGVQVSSSDQILTLITCDRSFGGVSGRLIVMAVLE